MSINNIELSGALLSELYKNSLIEERGLITKKIPEAEPDKKIPGQLADTVEERFKSLGNNSKNILVLVKYSNDVHLPDADLNFLTGIIGACKLSLNDVAIVNLVTNPGATYKEMLSFFKSRIVLLFDIEPASIGLPMNFPHYQLQAFAGNTFLYSPALQELENDKVLKSKLWVCLKRLFNI
jgi:hypothetical protein